MTAALQVSTRKRLVKGSLTSFRKRCSPCRDTSLAHLTAHRSPLGPSALCTVEYMLSLRRASGLNPSVAICRQQHRRRAEEAETSQNATLRLRADTERGKQAER